MCRSLRLAVGTVVLVLSLADGGMVHADNAAARNAQALDLFEKSEVAYDTGRFADAIDLLRRSYELKKEPVLLYNLGRAYEGLGDLGAAAQSYEAFLAAQPNTQDRGALERRIATLRRQLAERDALRKQAVERSRQERPRTPSAVPWIVGGVGVAGLAAGTVFGILSKKRNDDAKSEPTYLEADRLHSQAKSFAIVADVCFVAGAVVLVSGVIWGILDVSASQKRSAMILPGSFVF